MNVLTFLYKGMRKIKRLILAQIHTPYAKVLFYLNNVDLKSGLKTNGIIKVSVTKTGKLIIGKNCRINSGQNYNVSGGAQKNLFWVEGTLSFGDNVKMSSSSFFCKYKISIGNNVTIGGNTLIMDTDSHSLNPQIRGTNNDRKEALVKSVLIKDNVFIGARTTILKGVTIGENSIVGACSVVTKDIPDNQIWGGNPARFIKEINLK